MLRFLGLFALRLLAALAVVCVLIAHQWGWSEYASPELYVVYYQFSNGQIQYYIANADGSSPGVKIGWQGGGISKLDCSPDGRTFAFLTDTRHLYQMTSAGIVYDSAEDQMYTTVNVADDGTTALFDPAAGKLLVNARGIDLSEPNQTNHDLDRIDISAQGLLLWTRDFNDIQVVSLATGQVVPYVSHGYSGQWFASGQIFVFADQVTDSEGVGLSGGQYIMDMATQKVLRIGDWTLSSPLSPDATEVAVASPITQYNHIAQIVVYPLLGQGHSQMLTHDSHTASQPVCFLTFRPQMLISSSP